MNYAQELQSREAELAQLRRKKFGRMYEWRWPDLHRWRIIKKRITADPMTDCWLGDGSTDKDGYMLCVVGSTKRRLQRVVYELFHGPIPASKEVGHTCDVRNCLNPKHLIPQTHQENMQQCVDHGRLAHVTGEHTHNHKLTEADIKYMLTAARDRRSVGKWAAKFGVTKATIYQALRGRTWQCVPRS